jgi:hypothetical protein
MAKSCYSYALPFCSLLVILYSDLIVVILNLPTDKSWGDFVFILFYNLIAFMAIWSHLTTMLTDPGYVPKGY